MATPEVTKLVEMGFPADKAEKALSITGNKGIEPAMEWLLSNMDDQPEPSSSIDSKDVAADNSGNGDKPTDLEAGESLPEAGENPTEAKSLKCNDCNKLFQTQLEVEYHAAKSGHSNFSESTEEKKPLTEEEKKEQLRLIEEKMKQKRKEREEKERREELEREKRRIQSGKELSAIKEKIKDDEMKKLVEQRKREKIEDQRARQRVKEQIEADRAARRLKYGDGQVASSTSATAPTPAPAPAPAPAHVAKPERFYNEARLQIRLTNGQALTHTFGCKEQLSAVRLYVDMHRTDGSEPFSLMTNFPKKIFTEEDYEAPLDVLGLVPSAVLILTKKA